MSKLFSKEPVSVESFESLDQVRKDYYENQWIQIRCSSCNSLQKYRLTKPICLDFYKRKAGFIFGSNERIVQRNCCLSSQKR